MLILVGGIIGAGKDTLSDRLMGEIQGLEKKRFAELPKRQCAEILGLDWEALNNHGPDKLRLRKYFASHAEALKGVYGENVWAKALMDRATGGSRWVVSDWRFKAEYEEAKEKSEALGIPMLSVYISRTMCLSEWYRLHGIPFYPSMDKVLDAEGFLDMLSRESSDSAVAARDSIRFELSQGIQGLCDITITNDGTYGAISDAVDEIKRILSP